MSVTLQNPVASYTANGVTTVFPFSFRLLLASDLMVQVTDLSGNATEKVNGVDYTVTGAGLESGGAVVFASAPASGFKVLVARESALTRDIDYQNNGDLLAESVNLDFDRLWLVLQEIINGAAGVNGSVRAPIPETLATLPAALARANMLLAFDSNGNPTVTAPVSGTAADVLIQLADAASLGNGDARIAVKYNAAGSVARTQHKKNADTVSIFDFGDGLATDGSADWSAAFAAANAASLSIDCGDASHIFKLLTPVVLRSGTTLFGEYPEIWQGTANTECFNIEGKSNITFSGLVGRGIGTDHIDSDSSRAVFAYGGTSGSNIQTLFCRFYNFAYTPVRHANIAGVVFAHNIVEGPGSPTLTNVSSGRCYGFLADAGCTDVKVFGGAITKTAQGIRLEGVAGFGIDNLTIGGIVGQHGCYLGSGLSDGTLTGVRVNGVPLIGIKVQASNAAATDNRRISIVGGSVANCGDQGILICNGGGSTAQAVKNRGVVVSGVTVRNTGSSGINLQNLIGGAVVGCTVDGAVFSGVNLSASSRVIVGLCVIENSALSGIRDESPCTDIRLLNNTLADNATAATPGDRFGILAQDMTRWEISGNSISDSAAKMQYGIYCPGGDQTTLMMRNNDVSQATEYALRLKNATDAAKVYSGNTWAGTLGPTFNEPAAPTVASAATLTLPQQANIVKVSGSTTITSINAGGHSGRLVMLVLTSTAQITDGGNIKLAGNATGAANRTVLLACDGVDWWEGGRVAT
jgi:hypothetical protein